MENNIQDLTKGYKGYNSDFTCAPQLTPYQYAENTIHELRKYEELKCCETGFHYCVNPLDVLDFYKLIGENGKLNIFTKVEALGDIDTDDNTKYATDKIKIGEKLSFNEYVKECIEYMKENCESEDISDSSKVATSGNYSQIATSGEYSQVATSGDNSKIATSGECSHVATSGYSSKVATSGNCSQIAVSGDSSQVATSGDDSRVAMSSAFSKIDTSGDYSQIATNGYKSHVSANGDFSLAVTSGYSSHVVASGCYSKVSTSGDDSSVNIQGDNSVGVNIGIGGIIKGVLGTWITLAEYDEDGKCIGGKFSLIDGVNLKPDTWYKLENGEFIEC